MWFDKKPRREVTEEPQHWPTERMIADGHADYAIPEDLEGLDESILKDIAALCECPEYAPDECIPCQAHILYLERQQERLALLTPPDYDIAVADEPEDDIPEGEVIPPLLDLIQRVTDRDKPVTVRFAEQVGVLRDLVSEMLEGPPIPPPGVTLEDLSLLVVATQRWIAMTEAQGVDLSDNQQQVLDATKTLVARLHHG